MPACQRRPLLRELPWRRPAPCWRLCRRQALRLLGTCRRQTRQGRSTPAATKVSFDPRRIEAYAGIGVGQCSADVARAIRRGGAVGQQRRVRGRQVDGSCVACASAHFFALKHVALNPCVLDHAVVLQYLLDGLGLCNQSVLPQLQGSTATLQWSGGSVGRKQEFILRTHTCGSRASMREGIDDWFCASASAAAS